MAIMANHHHSAQKHRAIIHLSKHEIISKHVYLHVKCCSKWDIGIMDLLIDQANELADWNGQFADILGKLVDSQMFEKMIFWNKKSWKMFHPSETIQKYFPHHESDTRLRFPVSWGWFSNQIASIFILH